MAWFSSAKAALGDLVIILLVFLETLEGTLQENCSIYF